MKIRILLDVRVYVPLTNGNAKRECHVKTHTKWMDGGATRDWRPCSPRIARDCQRNKASGFVLIQAWISLTCFYDSIETFK